MKDLFKRVWELRRKKKRIEDLIVEKGNKLGEVSQELEKTEVDIKKGQSKDYYVLLSEIFEENSELAEKFIKSNKVVHKLKIDGKKYKWQKSKIEGYLIARSNGVLLLSEPPEEGEYEKITFIQV